MKRLARLLALVCAAALVPAAARAGARLAGDGKNVLRNDTGVAGAPAAGAGLKLNGRIGAVGTSSFAAGAFKLHAGLMHTSPQPGTITTLVAVSKATGTLDLSWTAPGIDGFEGNAANGVYRIDYSSDPARLFSPTTYQLEVATSVVAGALETLQLTGLSPNTTYYVKIYLADVRRYFAEDSKRLEEPTLANAPVDPFFSFVGASSVTISWLLPAGGSAGYDLQGSSTAGLGPGATVVSSRTPDGLLLSMSLAGLRSGTTYFFKVASLNWKGDKTFATILSTRTRRGTDALPVSDLAAAVDDLARTVRLSWTNPDFIGRSGVLVLFSTSPFAGQVADGTPFAPDQVLADAAVVRSTRDAEGYFDAGPLALDATFYYHVFSEGNAAAPRSYSIAVSTRVFLDLPPNAPAGLASSVSPDRTTVSLSWSGVLSNSDGSLFASTAAPRPVELAGYEVQRATSIVNPGWVKVSTLALTAYAYSEPIPNPNQTYFYRVAAADSFTKQGPSLVVDTECNFYSLSPDSVSRYKFSCDLANELRAGGNKFGADLTIRASTQPATGADRVFKAADFEVVSLPELKPVKDFQFSRAGAELALHYDVVGGLVVPASLAPLARAGQLPVPSAAEPAGGLIRAGEADRSLGMYWNNGQKFVKLFGKVDTGSQLVRVQTAMGGSYQIRGLARAAGFDLDLSGMSNKAITPNGDGKNDQVVFTFENPRDSAISGEVFDVNGARIASLSQGPLLNTLKWDGKANGRVVPSGVYVYQIRGEGKTFNGTVVVIR